MDSFFFSLVLSRESQPFSKLQFCTLLSPALAIVPTCVWSCQNTYSGPAGARAWDLHSGFSLKWTRKGPQPFAAWPEPRGHCRVCQDSCSRAAFCLRVVQLLKFTLKKTRTPRTGQTFCLHLLQRLLRFCHLFRSHRCIS